MTTEEFYLVVGGDYAGTKQRFLSDERVLRFVRRFPADGSFQSLKDNLASGNVQEAFRAAHTLKGVAQNLGFNALFEAVASATEVLRGGDLGVTNFGEIERIYSLIVESIAEIE